MKTLRTQSPVMVLKRLAYLIAASGIACHPIALYADPAANTAAFHISNQWNLGGSGGWGTPLFDSSTHTLYIPRTDRIVVVDTTTGKVSGEVTGFVGARDVVLDDTGRFGYVTDLTDGTAGFVRIFDRTNLKLTATIPVGLNPDAIVFEPVSRTVFAFNSNAHSSNVIDTINNQVIATVPLPGRPGSAISDGNGSIFVEMPGLGQIVRIDATSRKVAATWPVAPCVGTHGLAFDKDRQELFSACENNKLVSINVSTGQVISVGEVADGPGDIRFDRNHHLIFVANGAGALTIFSRDASGRYRKLQELSTLPGAHTLAIDEANSAAYLLAAKFGQRTGNVSEELTFRPTPLAGTFTVIVVKP